MKSRRQEHDGVIGTMTPESDRTEPKLTSPLVSSTTLGDYELFLSFHVLISKTGERAARASRGCLADVLRKQHSHGAIARGAPRRACCGLYGLPTQGALPRTARISHLMSK